MSEVLEAIVKVTAVALVFYAGTQLRGLHPEYTIAALFGAFILACSLPEFGRAARQPTFLGQAELTTHPGR